MTLKNTRKTTSRWHRWREALSMCRWILVTFWCGRSCVVAVMNETGPMIVVCLLDLAELRAMTQEMANASHDFELRFQGHSP